MDRERVADLTLEEKAAVTAGADVWTVPGIESLGVPRLRMTDGPNGARGAQIFGGTVRSVCVPCGSALAATFDPELVERIGALLGREARQKRSRVLLAPTINLVRSPLFGRAFECYGEDPGLSGRLAAAFVRGVQSEGVATTPKHFVGNETEFERMTINSVIDERTLREVYLLPFEFAVRHGGSLGIMTAYNRLNGLYCSEMPELLTDILRAEWGFEGFVVSDWFAAGSTVESLEAGLDVQMPGPDRFFGAPVAKAIANGETSQTHLDAIVDRRLHVHEALDAWDDDADLPELGEESDEARALAKEAAAAAIVLLANDGLLPLSDEIGSVALVGPNAVAANIMGGGSAQLAAHRRPSLADALRNRLGDRLAVERGCVIDKNVPPIRPDDGFEVEFFASDDFSGDVVATSNLGSGRAIWVGEPAAGMGTDSFSARLRGTLTITQAGTHRFTLIQTAGARVLIDGEVVLDGVTDPAPPGEAFFGYGSIELASERHLEAGQRVDVVVETTARPGTGIRGLLVGHQPPVPADLFDRAVGAAAAADVAIVMVGTSSEWETEGVDRTTLDLPGDQNALVEAVCAANPRTCVIVNTGAPVTMSWASEPAAIVQCWLGGQEMSPALDEMLFGEADPGGRLPVTIPLAVEHTPAFGNFPGDSNTTPYGEGLLVGYRWYDSRGLSVRFPFGHGLSYTSFDWAQPAIAAVGPADCTITSEVTNTGTRAGSEVVQVYVQPPAGSLFRPRRHLVGSAKVHVEPGESATAVIDLGARRLAYWDPANADHLGLAAKMEGSPVSDSSAGDVPEPGWRVAAGEYLLHIARSSTDVVHTVSFVVDDPLGPHDLKELLP